MIDKSEYEIAKYLRSKLPAKQTNFLGHKVDYFIGTFFGLFLFVTLALTVYLPHLANRAIDLLLESKWAKADKRTDETKFPDRESVVDFMNIMLEHKFFHRVKTIIVTKEVKQRKTEKAENDSAEESQAEKKKSNKAGSSTAGAVEKSPEAKRSKKSGNKEKKPEKKEKKKVKFDMHSEQVFIDANEVTP